MYTTLKNDGTDNNNCHISLTDERIRLAHGYSWGLC